MKATITKIGIGLAVLAGISSAPLIPVQRNGVYFYQYKAGEYSKTETDILTNIVTPNTAPDFTDDDNNGLISVAMFTDANGNKVYKQISDTIYAQMKQRDGDTKNPKITDFQSVLETITPKASAAITIDSVNTGGGSASVASFTYAQTITGANGILWVAVIGTGGVDNISGITYNGVAMTLGAKIQAGSERFIYDFYLKGPATGTHNIVITSSPTGDIFTVAISYTGASQTAGIICTSNSNTSASSLSSTVTTTAPNSWVSGASRMLSAGTVGTGGIDEGNGTFLFDSGNVVSAGAYSMAVNITSGSSNIGIVTCPFEPAVTVTVSPARMTTNAAIRFMPGVRF